MAKMEMTFYLTGGQTVVFEMPLKEGETVTEEDLQQTAEQITEGKNLWMGSATDWSFSIPDMKNVAMVMFKPI